MLYAAFGSCGPNNMVQFADFMRLLIICIFTVIQGRRSGFKSGGDGGPIYIYIYVGIFMYVYII